MISFTRRTDATKIYYNYLINNKLLNRSNVVRDLGVLFDSKITFHNHILSIIARTSNLLGFIFRSLKLFKKTETHLTLYYSYIRNIMEYGCQIWNPYYHLYTEKLENIQRKFTRMLCYKFNIPRGTYQSRLEHLNMKSLFHKRLFIDELFLYKIVQIVDARATNVEFFSIIYRFKRQHYEHFTNVNLLESSLAITKARILEALPSEMWHNFRWINALYLKYPSYSFLFLSIFSHN